MTFRADRVRHYWDEILLRLWHDPRYLVRRLGNVARAVWAARDRGGRTDRRPVVVFHAESAKHRVTNQAKALRRSGRFRLVLLAWRFDYGEQAAVFDEVRFCWGVRHFRALLRRLAARSEIHAVVCDAKPIAYAESLLDRPRRWPLLVSIYDSFWALAVLRGPEGYPWPHCQPEVEGERRVIPRCDGVIARGGDFQEAMREVGVEVPTLGRHDLCDRALFQPIRRRPPPPDGAWSVVVAAQVVPMRMPDDLYREAKVAAFGPAFRGERIHLHVYPGREIPFRCPVYEREVRENPFFHLHRSLPPTRIHAEIARYDFAFLAFPYGPKSHPDRFIRHILSLRVFTYLEAGLPLICFEGQEAHAALVRRYGCGIVLSSPGPAGLRAAIESHDLDRLREGVGRAREALDTEACAGALEAFLEEARARRARGAPDPEPAGRG